jgi:hypothetical protein
MARAWPGCEVRVGQLQRLCGLSKLYMCGSKVRFQTRLHGMTCTADWEMSRPHVEEYNAFSAAGPFHLAF